VLGQNPNKFIAWLKQTYLFHQGSALVPRSPYLRMGRFVVKATMVEDKARHQTFVTPKGVQYFARQLNATLPLHDTDLARAGTQLGAGA